MNDGCFGIFALVFYSAGFSLLGYGLWNAHWSATAANWPSAPATITTLDLCESNVGDATLYEVKIRCSYLVGGIAHECSRIAFGYVATDRRGVHDQIYQRLKAASSVSVRYDPRDPATACLSFGLHRSLRIILAFAASWLLFTTGFVLLYWLSAQDDRVLVDNLLVRQ